MSLFSAGRGLRRAPIADLNTSGAVPFSWNLELVLEKDGYKTFLTTNAKDGSRSAKIDNTRTDSLSKFEEIMWILWSIPSMNNIFIGPIAERRGFFDHLVGGYSSGHRSNLKTLAKLQRERLHVLSHGKDETWLDTLERKIAEENIKIIRSRCEFVEALQDTFNNYPSEFLRPCVSVAGTVEDIYETHDEESAILEISHILKKERFRDAEKQVTTVGCHKTFWRVKHSTTALESEKCSTGEQKAFLISLILASVRIYRNIRAGVPVLLLDDLMLHLDKNRRKSLINELRTLDVQTFLTGTEYDQFEDLQGIAQLYRVEKSICTSSETVA
jgi:DNA replication and repair protein RecF